MCIVQTSDFDISDKVTSTLKVYGHLKPKTVMASHQQNIYLVFRILFAKNFIAHILTTGDPKLSAVL
jgi:hypothetical protein